MNFLIRFTTNVSKAFNVHLFFNVNQTLYQGFMNQYLITLVKKVTLWCSFTKLPEFRYSTVQISDEGVTTLEHIPFYFD